MMYIVLLYFFSLSEKPAGSIDLKLVQEVSAYEDKKKGIDRARFNIDSGGDKVGVALLNYLVLYSGQWLLMIVYLFL